MTATKSAPGRGRRAAVQGEAAGSLPDAREGLIRLFEDGLMRAARAVPRPQFEPLLIVDMRRGHFQTMVLSLRMDGSFHIIPRPIKVEIADQLSTARERTPLHVYRKGASPTWIACSEEHFRVLEQRGGEYTLAENILDYANTLPDSDRVKMFARMWGAFLMPFAEADSGQDYQRVILVTDDDAHQLQLLQSALQQLAPRLEKGGGRKWQSAILLPIEKTADLRGYSFFHEPLDLQADLSRCLLMQPEEAFECSYDGIAFRSELLHEQEVQLSRYQRITAVGIGESSSSQSDVLTFATGEIFETACLAGYIYWWLQLDDARLQSVRQRREQLLQQLSVSKQRAIYLQHLSDRLHQVLHAVTAKGN